MKILKYILIILVLIVLGLGLYLKLALPNVEMAPNLKVDMSPEKIERGKYLANTVCVCIDCHSSRDWTKFAGPPVKGTFGKGGELFDEKFGFPGSYVSKNITPVGLKDWTDGEIFRAITCGVSKDGHALFPVMPYPYYGQMDEEDIKCIIAYIRTLEPVDFKPAESKSNFPMNFIINTIPKKGNPVKLPSKTDEAAYGKYIATSAGCVECHSPVDKGRIIAGKEFSGGREFPFPNGNILRSSNLTTDRETGIGAWSKEQFVKLFKARSDSAAENMKVGPTDFNTIMPWVMYGKMTEEDLGAIYTYLRSIKGIKNQVEKFTPKS
jgi:mono/diheme cytochrome c family protein